MKSPRYCRKSHLWHDLGKIVKVAGEITASVGGTSVEGEYSVKDAGDTPDAGENKEYTILFTSDDGTYSDVEVYTGTVTIARRPSRHWHNRQRQGI